MLTHPLFVIFLTICAFGLAIGYLAQIYLN